MVQTFPVPEYLCPRGVKTGPIMTLEPRRRRFHKSVDYHVAIPEINREDYHHRLLCSISEGNFFLEKTIQLKIVGIMTLS